MDVDRLDVEDYLKARKTPFCTDATNRRTIYERNKVRLELLPLLAREYNSRITTALSDLAATAGEDYEFISSHARKQFEKKVSVSGKKVRMLLKGVHHLHPSILRLVFRQMAEVLTRDPAALGFEHIQDLENLAFQKGPGRIDLPHHLRAVKTKSFLELRVV